MIAESTSKINKTNTRPVINGSRDMSESSNTLPSSSLSYQQSNKERFS